MYYSVIKLPWILLMQTVWTFLVYFWLLGGSSFPLPPNPSCVHSCCRSVWRHVLELAERSWRRPSSETSWQSAAR